MSLAGFLATIVLLSFGIVVLYVLSIYFGFRKSSYRDASGNSFLKLLLDKGSYGEFLIFSALEKLNGHKRLLTNIYLPKGDDSTTEVDVVMIGKKRDRLHLFRKRPPFAVHRPRRALRAEDPSFVLRPRSWTRPLKEQKSGTRSDARVQGRLSLHVILAIS